MAGVRTVPRVWAVWLGIDLGTSSVKLGLVDPAGTLCWVGDESCEPSLSADRAEIDPERWWTTTRQVIRGAPPEMLAQVTGIGLSGQMHGLVLVDEHSQPIRNAILWPDRRATGHLGAFHDLLNANPTGLGNPVVPGMPGPVLLWLREFEPELWSSPFRVLTPKDWLRSRLTGEAPVQTEPSDASATLLYDIARDAWSVEAMTLVGVDETMMAPLGASSDVAGVLSDSAGRELGLPPQITVAIGAGDTAAALLGLGIEEPGTTLLNIGTGGQVLSVVSEIDGARPARGLHQYRTGGDDKTWYAMAAVLNGGLALGWVRSLLGMEWDELYHHADTALTAVAQDPVFLPFLAGERDPEIGPAPKGAWTDLGVAHDRASLARSALVGTAAYLARRAGALPDADRIVLSGGSIRNPGWTQLMSNLLASDVNLAVDAHASVRGAAVLGAKAGGHQLPPVVHRGQVAPQPSRADQAASAMNRLDAAIAKHAGEPGAVGRF